MAEQPRKAPHRPAAEHYYAEYVRLPAAEGSAQAALREVIGERKASGWKLISATKEPSSDVLLLRWDTSDSSPARRRSTSR